MSDFKSMFKQAAAQRGSVIPTKEQLKALKAQKSAAGVSRPGPEAGPGPSSVQQARQIAPSSAAPKAQASSLPADFFEAPKAASAPAPVAAPKPAPQLPKPTSAPQQDRRAGAAGPGPSSLPAGFFADKAADAAARGVKLPTAKDKEAEFQEFTKVMEEELNQQAVEEAQEADEEANDKEDREAFEHMLRMQRVEALKARKAGSGQADAKRPAGEGIADAASLVLTLPAKKRRVVDVLQEVLEGGDSDGSSSSEDEDGDDAVPGVLDWRAKSY